MRDACARFIISVSLRTMMSACKYVVVCVLVSLYMTEMSAMRFICACVCEVCAHVRKRRYVEETKKARTLVRKLANSSESATVCEEDLVQCHDVSLEKRAEAWKKEIKRERGC